MKRLLFLSVVFMLLAVQGQSQTDAPLKLIKSMEMLNVPTGPYTDHLAVDLKGLRLFTTPQAQESIQVFDLRTGTFLHQISEAGNIHDVLYRADRDRIYAVEDSGMVRIYDGTTYGHLQDIKLHNGADCMAYDPTTKYLYVANGGKKEKLDYSVLSIVDTTTDKLLGEIRIPSVLVEQMAVDGPNHRLYINLMDKNVIAVVDTQERKLLSTWSVTQASGNISIALDGVHHRLFVGCRTSDMKGDIVVFDTESGKELKTLPIAAWTDQLAFDPQEKRIYAVCGAGYVYVYQQRSPNEYELIGKVETAVLAKTGLLVPELKRLFVSNPQIGSLEHAKVMVFETE